VMLVDAASDVLDKSELDPPTIRMNMIPMLEEAFSDFKGKGVRVEIEQTFSNDCDFCWNHYNSRKHMIRRTVVQY
jgi:hypothetical protein